MVRIFEDIETNRVFDISEIEEDNIITTRFWNLVKDFFVEITMRIYESDSSPSVYVLENHPLEHRCFTASCHSYDENMSLESFCIDRDRPIFFIISEYYEFFSCFFLFFFFFDDCSYCFSFWSDIFWCYFDYFFF